MHKKIYQNVEFSFGKGVGDQIYDAINDAKHSVLVITPYISQGYIDFLLRKKEEGVNVSLVTTTDAQRGKLDEICKKIVVQHCVTDEKKMEFKKQAKNWCLLSALVSLLIGFTGLVWHSFHNNFPLLKELNRFWHDDTILIITIACALFFCYALYNKFHRIKVFSYFYSTKFPFVVVPSIYSKNIPSITPVLESFVHAKIYVVDNRDIFIGSVNLTKSGLRYNIESFVKISAHETVKEIVQEINSYLNKHCKGVCINQLGANLYTEAPY